MLHTAAHASSDPGPTQMLRISVLRHSSVSLSFQLVACVLVRRPQLLVLSPSEATSVIAGMPAARSAKHAAGEKGGGEGGGGAGDCGSKGGSEGGVLGVGMQMQFQLGLFSHSLRPGVVFG